VNRARCIEVFLSWGEGPSAVVLFAAFVRENERFVIGEAPGCDAFVPIEALEVDRAEVIQWNDCPRVVPPERACVRVDGNDVAAEAMALDDGEVIEILLGAFVLSARIVQSETLPRGTWRVGRLFRGLVPSLVVHAACAAVLAMCFGGSSHEKLSGDFAIMQQLLVASEARELDAASPPRIARNVGHVFTRARGAPGRAAPARPEPTTPPAAAPSGDPTPGGSPAKEAPADPTESRAWRDQGTPLAPESDRVQSAFTEKIGEGVVGLSGTGLGGGGKGEGVPLTDILDMSAHLRANLERMGTENSGEFYHLKGTHVTRPPPFQPMPRPIIERVVAANAGRFRACHGLGLRRNPRLSGRVEVAFTIGAAGQVTQARDAGGELDDEIVRTCVVRTFLDLRFAPPADSAPHEMTFSIPLTNEPR
jgi:hypothetical protein